MKAESEIRIKNNFSRNKYNERSNNMESTQILIDKNKMEKSKNTLELCLSLAKKEHSFLLKKMKNIEKLAGGYYKAFRLKSYFNIALQLERVCILIEDLENVHLQTVRS